MQNLTGKMAGRAPIVTATRPSVAFDNKARHWARSRISKPALSSAGPPPPLVGLPLCPVSASPDRVIRPVSLSAPAPHRAGSPKGRGTRPHPERRRRPQRGALAVLGGHGKAAHYETEAAEE